MFNFEIFHWHFGFKEFQKIIKVSSKFLFSEFISIYTHFKKLFVTSFLKLRHHFFCWVAFLKSVMVAHIFSACTTNSRKLDFKKIFIILDRFKFRRIILLNFLMWLISVTSFKSKFSKHSRRIYGETSLEFWIFVTNK